jgi:hypothetical protein
MKICFAKRNLAAKNSRKEKDAKNARVERKWLN